MCEGGGGLPGSDGDVTLDSGDALGVMAYNMPRGNRVVVTTASPALTVL